METQPRKFTRDQIETFKAQYPDHKLVRLLDERTGDEYIFKIPDRGTYERFRANLADDSMKPRATRLLVDACAVSPTGAEFSIYVTTEHQAGLVDTFGNKLLEQSGLSASVTVEKL